MWIMLVFLFLIYYFMFKFCKSSKDSDNQELQDELFIKQNIKQTKDTLL